MRRAHLRVAVACVLSALCAPALGESSIRLGAIEPPAASRGVASIRDASGDELVGYSASYALVIGVSKYTRGWKNLPGVVDDLREVEKALARQGFVVKTVRDPDRRTLRDVLEDFALEQGSVYDARLLIYFAGHGHTVTLEDGRSVGYLVTSDAPTAEDGQGRTRPEFRRGAYSMEYFNVLARIIEAKHVLFVFDSCFAGTVFGQLRGQRGFLKADLQKPIRYFITSGDKNQQVPDESRFREYFVRALTGGAPDLGHDGVFLAEELGTYLRNNVGFDTRESQTPMAGPLFDPVLREGRFIFGLGARNQKAPLEEPSAPSIALYNTRGDPALGRLLHELDALVHLYGESGPEYRQHDWSAATDEENLRRGVDNSRAIWFAFTRAGFEYNERQTYLTSAQMVGPTSLMAQRFDPCALDSLRTGDVIVYRDELRGDGHSVIVIDPERRIAWGSHGFDANRLLGRGYSGPSVTGVSYQRIRFKPDWQLWDRAGMRFAACWRHRAFAGP